jgi:hypothetical protein
MSKTDEHQEQILADSYEDMLTTYLDILNSRLISQIKLDYDGNFLNHQNLNSSFKQILDEFFEREDIQPIDIFTIFSSLKKMERISFQYDSKNFTFCFSSETLLTFGKSEIMITVDSSMIAVYLKTIFEKLDTSYQNIVYMLYHDALKEISSIYFGLSQENLAITNLRHILYWMNLVTIYEKLHVVDMFKRIMRDIMTRKIFNVKWQFMSANKEISSRVYQDSLDKFSLHKFIKSHFVQLSPTFNGVNAYPNFGSFYKYFIYVKE